MANEEQRKYYTKLDIVPVSIDNIKRIIKTNIKNTIESWKNGKEIEKQTFHVIGEAGVGKTQISIQIADELSKEIGIEFKHLLIKGPVLSRDDFLCPFPVIDNGKTRFKMLYSDFVPLDENSYGIFIIDEFSRADTNLQQLLWQVQNEYKIHTKDLPKGWFVICLDNPDDQEYSMNYMEDAAGLRRTLHLYTEVNALSFLNYAIEKQFHPLVVEFIQIHPDYLYDFDSQKQGRIYSNPASWERVSNILWGYNSNISENLDDLTTLLSGLLNSSMTRMFLSFARDKNDISPKDVFFKYSSVRKEILKFAKNSDNVKLGQLMDSFVTFLTSSKPDYTDKELKNVSTFLTDVPSDIGAIFLTKLSVLSKSSPEYKYVTNIHISLIQRFEEYKTKYYEVMVEIGRKING